MRLGQRLKLRSKLLITTGLLVFLPLLFMGILVVVNLNNTIREEAYAQNSYIGQSATSELLRCIDENKHSLVVGANKPGLGQEKTTTPMLNSLKAMNPNWDSIYYVSAATGQIEGITPYQRNQFEFDFRTTSWYQQALFEDGVAVSDLYTHPLTGMAIITFSTAVYNSNGELTGVLGGDITANTLEQDIMNKFNLASGTYLWVIDSQGRFLIEPLSNQISLSTPSYKSQEFSDLLSEAYLITEEIIPESKWQVIVAQDPSIAFADARRLTMIIVVIILISLLAAFLAVLLFVRNMMVPVQSLLTHVEAIEQGADWHDLPPLATRFDELGSVSRAFEKITEELQGLLRDVITALTTALDARDPYTRYHSERVSIYAYLLADYLGWGPIESENVLRAALLHDVGKIGISEDILNKPGSLTSEELETMKTHCQRSYDIVQGIPFYVKLGIGDMILQHHERWDGSGYPDHLQGLAITPGARVLAIADSFDAMTSNRSYRQALSLEQALQQIQLGTGKQFDPEMVQVFLGIPPHVLLDPNAVIPASRSKRVQLDN